MSTNKLPEDYVHSGSTGEAAASPPSGVPETGGLSASPAPTRSRTSPANQTPRGGLIGTPGTASRRAAAKREAFRSYSALTQPVDRRPQPGVPKHARRRGDAGALPANPPPVAQDRAVRAQHVLPVTGTVRKAVNPWAVVVSVVGMIGMVLLCVMFRPAAADPNPHASAAPETRAGKEPALQSVTAGLSTFQQRNELPADPGAALTMALDHLSSALDEAAGGSQEEILRKASAPGQDCRMAWTNDTPSLVFGRFPIRANSLAHTLEACAQAVLRMR
jgi:hypothetical protein